MGWFLNAVYLLGAMVALPLAAWRYIVRRKPTVGWWPKLTGRVSVPPRERTTVWLHAVSVGEVNLLGHLLPRLEKKWPACSFVVSTTTWTGYELAQKRFGAERTFFFPWDFTWSVAEALRRIQPSLIVLTELEMWPNFLRAARRQNIPVAIVNGRLSERSFRGYRQLPALVRKSFSQLAWVGAQNEEYSQRFAALGVHPRRITVTGNLKFDGAQSDRTNPATQKLGELVRFPTESCIWLAGSTQDPEERIVLESFRSLRRVYPQLQLVLAPRHPERCSAIVDEISRQGLFPIQRSRMDARTQLVGEHVLVIDTVGELAAWWGISQIAFVGGSFGNRGGQNMLEPAAYGAAVCFGPNTKNFRDVVSLLVANDAAEVVHNADELKSFVERCLNDVAERAKLGERARRLIQSQTGASTRTIEALSRLLPNPIATGDYCESNLNCDPRSSTRAHFHKAG